MGVAQKAINQHRVIIANVKVAKTGALRFDI